MWHLYSVALIIEIKTPHDTHDVCLGLMCVNMPKVDTSYRYFITIYDISIQN